MEHSLADDPGELGRGADRRRELQAQALDALRPHPVRRSHVNDVSFNEEHRAA
jgi:hypothetical protein